MAYLRMRGWEFRHFYQTLVLFVMFCLPDGGVTAALKSHGLTLRGSFCH